MPRLELQPVGVSIHISPDNAHLEEARKLEDLGYGAIWLSGGQIDGLERVSDVVRATSRIVVGSAIISPDVYDAHQVATLYADLQKTSPDRFIVGLGGSQGPGALSGLNTYLDELDTAAPPVPSGQRILAALGPRKLELARARSAGAIALLVTPEYTTSARTDLGPDATLIIDQPVVLDTDSDRARETARGMLRFLSQVGGYAANFRRMGFSDVDIDQLSDHLVDELVVWGNENAIADRVTAHLSAGADQVVLAPMSGSAQPRPIEVARRLSGRLLGSAVTS